MEKKSNGPMPRPGAPKKGELLALGSLALAVACALPGHALAASYTVSTQAELAAAINAANASSDPSSTITLAGNVTFTTSTMLPTPTKALTIDTGAYTLTGPGLGNGITFSTGGGTLVVRGSFYGGDGNNVAGNSSNGGGGLGVNRGSTNLTNYATVTGGAGGTGNATGDAGGVGVAQGAGTFTNYGTVTGGFGDGGLPSGVGTTLISGGTVTNHGSISGGASRTGTGGIGLQTSSGGGTLNNFGTIQGGESLGGTATGGYGVYASATGASVINNAGTIRGGTGAAAIHGISSLNIVNSGTISAGAGQANAIQLGSATRTITLQLQAGSVIDGNVVGGTTAGDTLILGGDASATFDVSSIGAAAQYQDFDVFRKTGASTWSLTGTGTSLTPWTIQQGTLQVGNGGTSGNFTGDVTDDAMLAFDRSDAFTFANLISGTGAVSQVGTGTTTLTGLNTYTGGTRILAGTLRITSDANLGDAAGGLVLDGGTLGTGADIASARAVTLDGTGTFATDSGTTLTLGGVVSGSGTLAKAGGGTLVLAGSNTYTGGTMISGGTLQLGNGGTGGSLVGDVANGGTLVFDRSDELNFAGTVSGSGEVVQAGTGTTVFNGTQTYTGATSIEAGRLAVNGSISSMVTVHAAGTLGGTGTIFGNVANAGTVAPGNSIGTLTVAGNYVGQGGTLAIEAALGGDDSATDRLLVTGSTSGTTRIRVINLGGAGGLTTQGVKVIDVQGASNGNFDLAGDYLYQGQPAVVAGAYAYRLYKNGVTTPGDGDWYLRSEVITPAGDTAPPGSPPVVSPLYAPGVPLYEVYAGVLQRLNQLGTLQQRVGSPDFDAGTAGADGADTHGGAVWARAYTEHAELSPQTSTADARYDVTTQKLQVGVDGLLHEGSGGVLVAGITAQSGKADSHVDSPFGEGRIKTTGYGVGATLTWYGASGFYVDAQAQWNRYRGDIDSYPLGRELVDGNHGSGVDLGVEAGEKFSLNDEWSLIPQGQLIYGSVRFDDFTDAYGARVSRQDGDSLFARAGLAVDHQSAWRGASGGMNRVHVYGIANLYYDFMDGTRTNVSGLGLGSRNAPLWGGIGLGGSMAWKDGRYRLFGEALAQTSVQHFGDSSSYSLRVGFAMNW